MKGIKRIFLIKQVHATFAAVSTEDVWLCKEVSELPKNIEVIEKTFLKKEGFLKLYLSEDKTFYDKALHSGKPLGNSYKNTDEFKQHIQKYLNDGWSTEEPEDLKEASSRYWCERKQELNAQRKKEGYVIHKEDLTPEDYRGGLSDDVWNTPSLQEYVGGGSCFGYIGHTVRTKALDTFIDQRFLSTGWADKEQLIKLFCLWLTSTDGRHFGDSLEGYSLEEQMFRVNKHLSTIYNLALAWSKPEHNGTWASTQKMLEKYDAELVKDQWFNRTSV